MIPIRIHCIYSNWNRNDISVNFWRSSSNCVWTFTLTKVRKFALYHKS